MTINFYFDYEKQVATSPPFVTGSNVFVIIVGASGPGVHNIAQWDIDFSCVGILKEREPCNQSAVSKGMPLELLQECSDTYSGSAPILAVHESCGVVLDPFNPVDLTHLMPVPD